MTTLNSSGSVLGNERSIADVLENERRLAVEVAELRKKLGRERERADRAELRVAAAKNVADRLLGRAGKPAPEAAALIYQALESDIA